jgi:hypothetical protein
VTPARQGCTPSGIRVDARDQIEPSFRVPAVRIEAGCMGIVGALSSHHVKGRLAVVGDAGQVAADRAPRRPSSFERKCRGGAVIEAIVEVLGIEGPGRMCEIHDACLRRARRRPRLNRLPSQLRHRLRLVLALPRPGRTCRRCPGSDPRTQSLSCLAHNERRVAHNTTHRTNPSWTKLWQSQSNALLTLHCQ